MAGKRFDCDAMMPNSLYKNRYIFFTGLILLGYAFNLGVDIMDIDAAQYAEISREMAETGRYLQVFFRGEDYLDKPPLLFWVSSVGITLFGNTSFGYKVFPVLLLMIGLYGLYRFTKLWYDQRTGIVAMLLLGATQAYALMSNDIRTDGLLTTFTILSVWQLSEYIKHKKIKSLVFAGLCIGGAMLAKGPIGLFIPAVGIGGHLIFTGQWKKIFDPKWLFLLPLIALVLVPMCYGLYTQFDMHPEKEAYGLKGPSGLRFYFWTQSFGRITGESEWDNNTPWYYFLQTMLWDIQPWLLLLVPAWWSKLKTIWTKTTDKKETREWISFCGFVIPFIALSLSGYKLPHYIFPVFPFAAIIMASWLVSITARIPRWLDVMQVVVIHLFFVAAALIMFWVFPVSHFWLPVLWILFYAGMWWWRSGSQDALDKWLLPSLIGILCFQWIMALHFYPRLMQYQAGSQAGKFILREQPAQVYWYDEYDFAMDYYSDRIIPHATESMIDTLSSGTWVYLTEKAIPAMPPHKIIRAFDAFRVTRLSISFINPATRKNKVEKMFLVELE